MAHCMIWIEKNLLEANLENIPRKGETFFLENNHDDDDGYDDDDYNIVFTVESVHHSLIKTKEGKWKQITDIYLRKPKPQEIEIASQNH